MKIVKFITFEIRKIETLYWHHCVFLIETIRNMYMMTFIGQFKLELRSRSGHGPIGGGDDSHVTCQTTRLTACLPSPPPPPSIPCPRCLFMSSCRQSRRAGALRCSAEGGGEGTGGFPAAGAAYIDMQYQKSMVLGKTRDIGK